MMHALPSLLPGLAAAFLAAAPAFAAAPPITLHSRAIDTGVPVTATEAPATDTWLVQFPGKVSRENVAALKDADVRVYTYLPENAFLVRLPAGDRAATLASLGARWSAPWPADAKIGRSVWSAAAEGGREPLSVMVQVFPDRDLDALVADLQRRGVPGIAGRARNPYFSRLRLLLPPRDFAAVLPALAELDDVFFIELEPRRELLNDTSIWVGQSGLAGGQATPVFAHGLFGEGQTVAVLDTGIDIDMCFFRDPVIGLPPTNLCNGGTNFEPAHRKVRAVNFLWSNDCNGGAPANNEWDSQDHGSHVAGTVAGDNFANLLLHDTGDGMAPGAQLVIQDGGYQVDNCGDLPGIGCPVVDLNPIFQQTYDQGARIHSNSWGDKENAAIQNDYSAGSQDVDEFSWSHKDFLVIFAAGNSGLGTGDVSSPSTAKSAISVGSTQRAAAANAMSSFSSCGPTDDGRFKPEITMPGSSIISADNDINVATNNCGLKSTSGTSMATPGIAGLAALIRQYYADGFHPSGAADVGDAFAPSGALVRATLINSGENMTGTPTMPANCQGWGRALLDNTLYFPGDARQLRAIDDTPGFANGASGDEDNYFLEVEAGQRLKVTLAWMDFPSTPAATIHLVNDLDLELVAPNGTVYRGNVWSGGQSTTGGSADRRNTLEQVMVDAPEAGEWIVRVRAFQVPSGPQPYALVMAGAFGDPGAIFRDGFESGDVSAWSTAP